MTYNVPCSVSQDLARYERQMDREEREAERQEEMLLSVTVSVIRELVDGAWAFTAVIVPTRLKVVPISFSSPYYREVLGDGDSQETILEALSDGQSLRERWVENQVELMMIG